MHQTKYSCRLLALITALLLAFLSCSAQEKYQLKNFELLIDGTSTLHDWTSTVSELKATARLQLRGGVLQDITTLTLRVPVEGIKSSKSSIMDRKTWRALEAEAHPYIQFTLSDAEVPEHDGTLRARGILRITGVSRAVDISAHIQPTSTGYQLSGEHVLRMSDFGIDPPTAILGTLKTADEVTIRYRVNFSYGGDLGSR